MFDPADIPASKQEFMAAVDRQFPPKTDIERANYLARKELEKNAPSSRWAVMLTGMLFLAIPVVYWMAS